MIRCLQEGKHEAQSIRRYIIGDFAAFSHVTYHILSKGDDFMYKYATDRQYLIAPASRKDQMNRIAKLLKGRKCDIEIKHSKSRSLIIIY